ncbi:MAG: FtsX-like permease family protein [Chitinivibrionales bacterium]|nr:FtsX-like permease family protein [Chitinivibrionales bacterium]
MNMIARIAFRNIMRHKRRTITSAITIAVGIWFYTFMDSVMAGLDRGGIDNMIELTTSAVKVHTSAYQEDKEAFPLDHGIRNMRKLRKLLSGNPRIAGIAPRTRFIGQLSNYTEEIPVIGTVIDPDLDSSVFSLVSYLEGDYFSAGSSREIILGKDLAEEMGVDIGGYITLYALTRYESRNADEFKVAGVLKTTDPELNRSSVMISYAAANEFLDLEGLVTEANVGLMRRVNLKDMKNDARKVKERIETTFPGLEPSTFMELAAGFLELAKSKRAFGVVFLLILLVIAAVGIFNSVLMSVYERIREVGVLRAHGMKSGEVSAMFVLEGFMTGVLGSIFGLVLGIATNLVLVTYGYPIDKIAGDVVVDGFPVWGTIYGEWNSATMVFLFFFGIAVATVAGIIPARKAGKMEVTHALRFV